MKTLKHKPLFCKKVKMKYNGKFTVIQLAVDYRLNAKKMQEAIQAFSAAADELDDTEASTKRLSETGRALFACAFGEETADKIATFFEDNTIAMAEAFTPYILNVINPAIQRAMVRRAQKVR